MNKYLKLILISFVISLSTFLGVYKFLPLNWLDHLFTSGKLGSTIITLNGNHTLSESRGYINTSLSNLNSDKLESGFTNTASSTFNAGVNIGGKLFLGAGLNASSTATSTFVNGISLDSGCFRAPSGSCLGGGAGTVTSITAGTGLTGGVITTSGTVALDLAATNAWTSVSTTTFAGGLSVSSIGGITSASGLTITGGSILLGYTNATINATDNLAINTPTNKALEIFSGDIAIYPSSSFKFNKAGSSADLFLSFTSLTADRTLTFPDQTGTLCLVNFNCTSTSTANTWTALQLFTSTATTTFGGGIKVAAGVDTGFISNSGKFEFGTGSATSSLRYSSAGGGEVTFATSTNSAVVGFSAVKHLFSVIIPNATSASSSKPLGAKPYPFTAQNITCAVNGGTNAVIRLRDTAGNATNSVTCTPTGTTTEQALTSNNTFTRYEGVNWDIVSTSGAVNDLIINVYGTQTPN